MIPERAAHHDLCDRHRIGTGVDDVEVDDVLAEGVAEDVDLLHWREIRMEDGRGTSRDQEPRHRGEQHHGDQGEGDGPERHALFGISHRRSRWG